MKIKTSELTKSALNWAVAVCEGWKTVHVNGVLMLRNYHPDAAHTPHCYVEDFGYSTNWAQGGPIIDLEGISTILCSGDLGEPSSYWVATAEKQSWGWGYDPYHEQDEEKSMQLYKSETYTGPTPLIAAMRCYCATKLGDTVDVPDELVD